MKIQLVKLIYFVGLASCLTMFSSSIAQAQNSPQKQPNKAGNNQQHQNHQQQSTNSNNNQQHHNHQHHHSNTQNSSKK